MTGSGADREAYEQLKRRLAAREWGDMNEYADAKSELIAVILARASGGGHQPDSR